MDYENFCKRCKHYSFDLRKGILCGLTNDKPAFANRCFRFELDPQKDEHLKRNPDDADEANKAGVRPFLAPPFTTLLSFGVLHILVYKGLINQVWGVTILAIGVLNLIVRNRRVFVASGIAIITIGAFDILLSYVLRETAYGVQFMLGACMVFLGSLQLYGPLPRWLGIPTEPDQDIDVAASQYEDENHRSRVSITCLTLSLIANLIFFLVRAMLGQKLASNPRWLEVDNNRIIVGLFWLAILFLASMALALGTSGIVSKERLKKLSFIGSILSTWIFLASIFAALS